MTPSPFSADAPVAWGSVGSSNTWGFLAESGERGVTRTVEPNVSYTRPPEAVEYAWAPVPDALDRYEMPWGRNPADSVRTLTEIGEGLRKKLAQPGGVPANDPDLLELATAAVRLVRLADQLREAGWRPGLLHPRNVLVPRGQGGQTLILPDLGFVWEGGMMRPTWVSDREFAPLYDGEPAELQKQAGGGLEAVEPGADVPHLARLLACVLTGKARRDPVRPDDAPRPAPGTRAGATTSDVLWQLLGQAARGEVGSLDELGRRLSGGTVEGAGGRPLPGARLSAHFVPERVTVRPPPDGKKKGSPAALVAGLAVASVLLIGAAVLAFWRPWESAPQVAEDGDGGRAAATGPGLATPAARPAASAREPGPAGGLAADWLAKLRTAPPDEQAKILEAALGAGVPEAARQQNRRAFFADWKARLEELLKDNSYAAVEGLTHLYQEMLARQRVTATPLEKEEQQCLADLREHLAQLGSLR